MQLTNFVYFASVVIGAILSLSSHFKVLFWRIMLNLFYKTLSLLLFSNVCWLLLINVSSPILNLRGCKIGLNWILFWELDFFSFKLPIKRHIKVIFRINFNSGLNFLMLTTPFKFILSALRKFKQTFDWFCFPISFSTRNSGCMIFSLTSVSFTKKLGTFHQTFS